MSAAKVAKKMKYQLCRDGHHWRCPGNAPEREVGTGRDPIRASVCTCACHRELAK